MKKNNTTSSALIKDYLGKLQNVISSESFEEVQTLCALLQEAWKQKIKHLFR